MATQREYISCVDTAVLVRKALHKNFPGIKFSVRSDVYAGGASIDVGWILGPTVKEVDAIAGQYESANFDGSIDMECRYDHWLLPDGTTRVESTPGTEGSMGYIPRVESTSRPEGAKLVTFGSHYVHCQRSLTEHWEDEEKLIVQVAKDICALQRIEYKDRYTMGLFGVNDNKSAFEHAQALLRATSFKPGEEYASVRFATEAERNSPGWDPWAVFVVIKKGGIPPSHPSPETATPITDSKTGIMVRENEKLNGIELIFPSKPPANIISIMKASGWRWSHKNSLWYNKNTTDNKVFALKLQAGNVNNE